MNITTEVITELDIDDMLKYPMNYIDIGENIEIIKIWNEGEELFTISIGIDEVNDGIYKDLKVYIMLQNENSEKFYVKTNAWDTLVMARDKWIERIENEG